MSKQVYITESDKLIRQAAKSMREFEDTKAALTCIDLAVDLVVHELDPLLFRAKWLLARAVVYDKIAEADALHVFHSLLKQNGYQWFSWIKD
jgi:hypothetical protein